LIHTLNEVAVKFKKFMHSKFGDEIYPEQNEELQLKIQAGVTHFKKEFIEIKNHFKKIVAATDSKVLAKEFNELLSQLYIQTAFKYHVISSLAGGFSIETFLQAKKDFIAPKFQINAYAASAASVNLEVKYPELHQQLKILRNEICNKTNAPVYMVASSKSLEELATYLPQTKEDLLKISGFGKVNSEKYGDQFLGVIKIYCEDNNLETSIETKVAKRQRKQKDEVSKKEATHLITFKLIKEGVSINEIAVSRNLAVGTIETHIARCVGDGLLEASPFISDDKLQMILKEIDLITSGGLAAAKEKLGKDVSFFDIRLAINYQNCMNKLKLLN
jgi:hypothetical protein